MKLNRFLVILLLVSLLSAIKGYAETPKTVIMLIDVSESTSKINADIFEAATEIVKSVPLGDKITLIKFDIQPQLLTSLAIKNEMDKALLFRMLRSFSPYGKHTDIALALDEAYISCLTQNNKESKTIVILLTDGKISPAPSSKYYAGGDIVKQKNITAEIVNNFYCLGWQVVAPIIGKNESNLNQIGVKASSLGEIEDILNPKKAINKPLLFLILIVMLVSSLLIRKKIAFPPIELKVALEGKNKYKKTFFLSNKKWLSIGGNLSDFSFGLPDSVFKIIQVKNKVFLEPISDEIVRLNGNVLKSRGEITQKANTIKVKDKTIVLNIIEGGGIRHE